MKNMHVQNRYSNLTNLRKTYYLHLFLKIFKTDIDIIQKVNTKNCFRVNNLKRNCFDIYRQLQNLQLFSSIMLQVISAYVLLPQTGFFTSYC